MKKLVMNDAWCVPFLALIAYLSFAQRDRVIVRPVPIEDVLINPGMGTTADGTVLDIPQEDP